MKTTGLDAVLLALRGDSGLTGADKGDAGNNPAFTAAFDAAARSAAQQKAPPRDEGNTRRPDSAGAETGKALPGSGSDMPIRLGVATSGEAALEASESAKGSVAAPLEASLASLPFVKDALERAGATAVPADVKTSALAQPLPTASPPNAIGGTGNTAGDLAARMHEAAGRQPNPTVSSGASPASGAPAVSGDSPAIASQNKAAQPRDNPAFATAVRTVAAEARGPAGAENRVVPGGAAPVEGAKTTGRDQGTNVRQPGLNTGAALTSAPTQPGSERPPSTDAAAETLPRRTPLRAPETTVAAAQAKPVVDQKGNAGYFEGQGTRGTRIAAPMPAPAVGSDTAESQRVPAAMPSSLQRPPMPQSASVADGVARRGEVQVEQNTIARATEQSVLGAGMDQRHTSGGRMASGQPPVTADPKSAPANAILPGEPASEVKTTFNALASDASRVQPEQQPPGLKQDVATIIQEPVSRGPEGGAPNPVGNSAMPPRVAETVSQPSLTQLPDIKQAPDSPEFADEVLARVRMIQGRNGTEARLNLHPAELGRLQIAITSEGEATRVAFVVENAQAKEALEQAMPRLREFLQQAGLQLTDSSVAQQGDRNGADYGAGGEPRGGDLGQGSDPEGEENQKAQPGADPSRIVDAYA
ncbi:MAG: flagellar hook-length control protein FliK [Luminiphilus sp.]|nr:flagellar hook-length control protein FliK [Luminiphilus sp.]